MPENKKLVWDADGDRMFNLGTKRGVLYPIGDDGGYGEGVAWNGLTGVTESPSGAEPTDLWADDIKYGTVYSTETYGMTIESYTFPTEFLPCLGMKEIAPGAYIGQQKRKKFGFSWVTTVGNDASGLAYGYELHIAYGCQAGVSEQAHTTMNESPEAETMSFEVTTTPVAVTGEDPSASLTIKSFSATEEQLAALEAVLYGSGETPARLPLPDEIKTILGGTTEDQVSG